MADSSCWKSWNNWCACVGVWSDYRCNWISAFIVFSYIELPSESKSLEDKRWLTPAPADSGSAASRRGSLPEMVHN
jgi:hypothetical protein